jgi:hypothetical protein
MFVDSEFQRKMAGQCQQETEQQQQQEQSGALEKYDDRLAKSLLRGREPISTHYFISLLKDYHT